MSGLEESYFELLKARRVLIVGGGLVGCELASEISQHRFPGAYPKKSVTLVDSHSNVVNRSDSRQQSMASKYLKDLGVEVVCNEKILDFDSTCANVYLGSSGRVYAGYDKIFIATGTRPNSNLFTSGSTDNSLENCIDAWGRIKVKSTLQIDHWKYKHIFAGGDVTNVVEEKTGYAATISGVCIARNICRLVKGKSPLKQGTKGTLPAPDKPLHGMLEHGGIGKRKLKFIFILTFSSYTNSIFVNVENLNTIKKKFSFLNPSWAALKYFDEQQFLRIVQGQGSINSSQVLGRLPRRLNLPSDPSNDIRPPQLQHSRSKSQTSFQPTVSVSAYSTVTSRSSIMTRQTSFSSSTSSKSRQRSSSQTRNNHQPPQYERTSSRLDTLKHTNSITSGHQKSASSPSLMKNKHGQQNNSGLSRNNSNSVTANSSVVAEGSNQNRLRSLEGLLFEHFTYGGEDIELFSKITPPTSSCSSPSPMSPGHREATKQRESQLMTYDKDFQLSPPPAPKRRASLTGGFEALSCYDTSQQSVRLTRSPSFSSIIQNI